MRSFSILVAFALLTATSVAAQGNEAGQTLSAAQTRLRYAQEALNKADSQAKKQQEKLQDTEESLARQQQKLEETKAKIERLKNDLAVSRLSADEARKQHAAASAEIKSFYDQRQVNPAPSKPQ